MKIYNCENGPFMVNTYLVINELIGTCFIIDPGSDEISILVDEIKKNGLTLESILCTHGHIDHISGIPYLQKDFDVPLIMHRLDEVSLQGSSLQARMFGVKDPGKMKIDIHVIDKQPISIAGIEFLVLHTPGHSPGSISLYGGDVVFSGDTLFNMSIGRTDFPGGSYEELIDSIRGKLFTLPDDTTVLSGHGPATTIGMEKNMNPFFS